MEELKGYSSPEVEIVNVAVEHGFDASFDVGKWEEGGDISGDAE